MTHKKILIIAPHYPPSNLAAVHRTRLFAQHLPSLGWEPIILAVSEQSYEEELDWNLESLVPKNQRVEKVSAFPITKPRIIGDIGLRGFFQLRKKALQLVKSEGIDFVFIPIPSFYVALIGPYLHRKTGVKYGIDYIDPWVHRFPGSDKLFSRHWLSTQVAKKLEPIAVKSVSLITGVANGYYQSVIDRNPKLVQSCVFGAMPYGGEKLDHHKLKSLSLAPYLFRKNNKLQLVYAGAMLPNAYKPMEEIFKAISNNIENFNDLEIHFIGTGFLANDPFSFNIKPLAEKYNLWNSVVFEYPKRIPYLDVLVHLEAAKGVFILGSTEPHYTPSKTYQAVLSEKPIFAILHAASTAASIIEKTNAGKVIRFNGELELNKISNDFFNAYKDYQLFVDTFDPEKVDKVYFEEFSAHSVTKKLVDLLNKVVN